MSDSISRRGFFRSFKIAAAGVIGAGTITAARGPQAYAQSPGSLPFTAGPLARGGDTFVNPNKVLLWENTRKEIRQRLAGNKLKAAILPTGSIEQHNEHMAMVADVAIATLNLPAGGAGIISASDRRASQPMWLCPLPHGPQGNSDVTAWDLSGLRVRRDGKP